MSTLSLRDIQGIAAYGNEIRIPTGSSLNVVGNATVGTVKTNSIQSVAGKSILNTTGGIIQVVSSTSDVSNSTTSTTWQASPITASITPSASTNKILIMVHAWTACPGPHHCWTTIFRNDTTNLGNGDVGMGNLYQSTSYTEAQQTLVFLDSPSTISSTSYRLFWRSQTSGQTVSVGAGRRMSMILMEVTA